MIARRHSRESGNPFRSRYCTLRDSRFRGNDAVARENDVVTRGNDVVARGNDVVARGYSCFNSITHTCSI